MSITQSEAIIRLNDMANTEKVDDAGWTRALNFSLRELRGRFALPWAERKAQLLVYPNVYKYASPSDMDRIKPPQRLLNSSNDDDSWFQATTQRSLARARDKSQNMVAIAHDRTTKYLMVRYNSDASESVLHNLDDVDDNGTWAGSGDASGAATDTGVFFDGAGSVRFTVTNSSNSAVLTNSAMSAVDLTDYEDRSRIFFSLYVPVSGLTAVALRWGSSSSAYWEVTSLTTQHHGAAIEVGAWNLFSAVWNSSTTESGTPDKAAVNFARVALTNAGTSSTYYLDHLVFRRFEELELPFYSKNLVLDANGSTYKETLAENVGEDQIVGDSDFDELVIHGALKFVAKFILKDADLLMIANSDYEKLSRVMETRFPSQEARISINYYPLDRL